MRYNRQSRDDLKSTRELGCCFFFLLKIYFYLKSLIWYHAGPGELGFKLLLRCLQFLSERQFES